MRISVAKKLKKKRDFFRFHEFFSVKIFHIMIRLRIKNDKKSGVPEKNLQILKKNRK